jgi:hypothetical protein
MTSEVETKRGGSKGALAVLIIALVGLYGFGGYNLFLLISPWLPTIQVLITDILTFAFPWLASYWWAIFLFVFLLVVLGFVFAYAILRLMKRAAAATLKVLWLLEGIAFVAVGVLVVFLVGFPFGLFGLFFSFIGLLQFWVWFRRRQKLRRAGKLAEFTATLLLQEHEMFIAPLVTAIFSLITGLLMLATVGVIYFNLPLIGVSIDSWLFLIILILVEGAFMFVYFAVFYVFEGINVSVAHTWYREKDPNLHDARTEVGSVLGTVLAFAGVRTVVAMFQRAAQRGGRKGGGIWAVIGAIAAGLIGAIFRFITYFTLPAIIIEHRGLKDSIKRSAHTTWKYLVDVYIAETGVSTVFSFFGGLLSLGYFAVGFLFGYLMSYFFIGPDMFLALFVGLLFAILFLIFAAIPSYFIFRPLNTAYRTFMFAYALDEESGFRLPSRLPKEYRDTIEAAQSEWEASGKKRHMLQPPSEW